MHILKILFGMFLLIIPVSSYAITVNAVVQDCHVYSIGNNACGASWNVDTTIYKIDYVIYKGSLNVKGSMNFPWTSINSSSASATFPSAFYSIFGQAGTFQGYNFKRNISQFGSNDPSGTITCRVEAFGILDEAYADCNLRATVFYSKIPDPPTPEPSIPEPNTWVLLVAGFGATGVCIRRRRITLA